MTQPHHIEQAAERLAALYATDFGGKAGGRYRIAAKLVCRLAGRRRLYSEDVVQLTRAVFERGCVLIDMDTFFVVLSASTFANYRRANVECLGLDGHEIESETP